MNTERLQLIIGHIKAHPETYDQLTYMRKTACETAHCIAGHAVAMFRPEKVQDFYEGGPERGQGAWRGAWHEAGRDILELSDLEAEYLFYCHRTLPEIEAFLAVSTTHNTVQGTP